MEQQRPIAKYQDWQGVEWRGEARTGMVWRGEAGRGLAWRGFY